MKTIDQLSKSGLRKRRQHIMTMPLTPVRAEKIRQIEAREWELYREENPPVKAPANFFVREEEW
jgi:hypothetical protein